MTRRIALTLLFSFLFLAAGTGIFVLLLSAREKPQEGATTKPRIVVRVMPAVRQTFEEWIGGYGQGSALQASDVHAEVPGVVTWISPKLEAGAEVRGPVLVDGVVPADAEPGEILVKLDARDLERAFEDAEARREQADASVTRAEVTLASLRKRLVVARRDLTTAEEELGRIVKLLETGTATVSERDSQRLQTTLRERSVLEFEGQEAATVADLERARADVVAAKAREQRAKQDRDRTVIRAPYGGRIDVRHVRFGSRVSPGSVLFRIVDPSRVEVAVALGGSRFGEVVPGAPAKLRLREEGPDIWDGTISRVSPSVDPADRTFTVYAIVATTDGSPASIAPGAFVVARVRGAEHERVVAVPRTAFLGERLYVAERVEGSEDGLEAIVRERKPVVKRWLSDVALVEAGIEPGEEIVVTNLEELANESRVRIAEETPSPADAK